MVQKQKKARKFHLKTNGQVIVDTRRNPANPLRSVQPDVKLQTGKKLIRLLTEFIEQKQTKEGIATLGLSWNQFDESQETPGRVCLVRPSKGDQWIPMINPTIIREAGIFHWSYREGCLSSPGKWVNCRRHIYVDVMFKTIDGEEKTKTYANLMGNIVQHEIDHLDGIFFTDRIRK
jgi:peptide deformylase